MEHTVEYLKWSIPKNDLLVKLSALSTFEDMILAFAGQFKQLIA